MTTRLIAKYALPLLALALASLPASAATVRVYVTNSAGDTIDVIDPVSHKVVQEIKNIVGAHGIAFSPDASRVYVSNEETSTLDVFDRKSGKLIKKVALSDHPNNISVTKNGDRIVVAIARGKGGLDIIDAATLTLKKTDLRQRRPTAQRLRHPRQQIRGRRLHPVEDVLCLRSRQGAAGLGDADGSRRPLHGDRDQSRTARPSACSRSCRASTASRSSISPSRKEAARITLPSVPQEFDSGGYRDQRTVAWHRHFAGQQDAVGHQHSQQRRVRILARRPEVIGKVDLPSEKIAGHAAPLSAVANWVTFTPDGKELYVSNSGMPFGVGGRYRGDEGDQGHPGRRSAEAQQYAGDPRRRQQRRRTGTWASGLRRNSPCHAPRRRSIQ